MNLVINPVTQKSIERYLSTPKHALIVEAPAGSGKKTLATAIAAELLQTEVSGLANHAYYRFIMPEDKSITIEQIRGVKQFLRLKVPGSQAIQRVVVIGQAESMGHEAQNALLKILEEPPADTVIVLCSSNSNHLLPTVLSRAEKLKVLPVSYAQSEAYFEAAGHQKNAITRAYHISNGHAGLLSALLQSPDDHELAGAINKAKEIISLSQFERLCLVDQLTKQKESLATLLFSLERVCHSALVSTTNKANAAHQKHWQKALRAIITAQDQLQKNVSSKLVLTNLFLSF